MKDPIGNEEGELEGEWLKSYQHGWKCLYCGTVIFETVSKGAHEFSQKCPKCPYCGFSLVSVEAVKMLKVGKMGFIMTDPN